MDDRERARAWLNARTYKGRIERQESDWLDLAAEFAAVRREALEEGRHRGLVEASHACRPDLPDAAYRINRIIRAQATSGGAATTLRASDRDP